MEPRSAAAIGALIDKGVQISNPSSLDIGPEVDLDRISGDGVVIHPGCRVYGAGTVISAGVRLGAEGPVTIQDCRLGPGVALQGGYAADAVFLAGSAMGLGHHVRAGTLLEEQASGAHTVGLKQTILLPYVTLGSLINFCDCLMAGGTSRADHSEVGSSYIHFNFTPEGDKATPSLFGDVARGVTLRQRPIFLGGQGGAVGPVHVGYGTIVGAGSVLRSDVPSENQLVVVGPPPSLHQPWTPGEYRSINRLVSRNIDYLANLRALQVWYDVARRPFFQAQELGPLVLDGAMELLAQAWAERVSRLVAMVAKVRGEEPGRAALRARVGDVCAEAAAVTEGTAPEAVTALRSAASSGTAYLDAVRALSDDDADEVHAWLGAVVDGVWSVATAALPQLRRAPGPR